MFNEVADKFGFRRINDGDIDTLRTLSAQDMIKRLDVSMWKLPLIVAHMRKLKTRDIHTISLFPGVGQMMRKLHEAGIKLAIVSSNTQGNVEKVLGADNSRLVDYMDCGGSVLGKSSMLTKALRQTGVPAHRALCIGDELRDMEAAKSAGIPFGAVAWGYTKLSALQMHQPKETFATMDEIAQRVI